MHISLLIRDLWTDVAIVILHEQEMTAMCLSAHLVFPKKPKHAFGFSPPKITKQNQMSVSL